jgi:Uma2 family endonuclease
MTVPLIEQSLTVPSVPIWRLTVAQYHHMIDAGILTSDDPIELLEGWLVPRGVKTPRHSLSTHLVRDAFVNIISADWYIDTHEPFTSEDSEPEPDVMIVQGYPRKYMTHHPTPADVSLVVEVSDTTLHQDRTLKKRIYARAGIPVYWILNLQERQLEVFSEPDTGEAIYTQEHIYRPDDEVPLWIAGQEVGRLTVKNLLA